jgi:hypothetical protein
MMNNLRLFSNYEQYPSAGLRLNDRRKAGPGYWGKWGQTLFTGKENASKMKKARTDSIYQEDECLKKWGQTLFTGKENASKSEKTRTYSIYQEGDCLRKWCLSLIKKKWDDVLRSLVAFNIIPILLDVEERMKEGIRWGENQMNL